MESNWAAENLQVIRTLMERSAVYRRALAPTTLVAGGIGSGAALLGFSLGIDSARGFGLFWMSVAVLASVAASLIVRRQALREAEAFWSPPTRRVTQALMPAMLVGLAAGGLLAIPAGRTSLDAWWLPGVWMVLYGCALHAAGFFMTRGIRLFGWGFVVAGGALLAYVDHASHAAGLPSLVQAHLVMGGAFGGLHLAYGIYLLFTEPKRHVA